MSENINQEQLKTLRSRTLSEINMGRKRKLRFKVDFSDVNEEFTGIFEMHYPSAMENIQMGIIKSSLLGGVPAIDVPTDNLVTVISTLEIVIDKKPDWFDPFSEEIDYEVLEEVYLEYINWSNSFRRKNRKTESVGDSKDRGSTVPDVATEDVPSTTN